MGGAEGYGWKKAASLKTGLTPPGRKHLRVCTLPGLRGSAQALTATLMLLLSFGVLCNCPVVQGREKGEVVEELAEECEQYLWGGEEAPPLLPYLPCFVCLP